MVEIDIEHLETPSYNGKEQKLKCHIYMNEALREYLLYVLWGRLLDWVFIYILSYIIKQYEVLFPFYHL